MSELLSIEKLQLFLTFVVPGIVTLYVRSQFLTGRMPALTEGFVAYITISILYHAIIFTAFGNIYSKIGIEATGRVGWIALIFLIPAVFGVLLGLNVRKGWGAWVLEKAKINTVHPIDCAWDWRFSNCPTCWVRVMLRDGKEWAGVLGNNSFLSSNPQERDLFLEQVYFVDEENNWTAKSSSVWLSQSDIQSIEMWPKK